MGWPRRPRGLALQRVPELKAHIFSGVRSSGEGIGVGQGGGQPVGGLSELPSTSAPQGLSPSSAAEAWKFLLGCSELGGLDGGAQGPRAQENVE